MGADIWHYTSPNLHDLARNLAFLLLGDFVVGLITHWCVRLYSDVNLLVHSVRVSRLFGPCIAFTFGFLLYNQMCITLIHCGMDPSFSPRSSWPDLLVVPDGV